MRKIIALMLSLAACSNAQQGDGLSSALSEDYSHAVESTSAEVTETESPQTEDDADISNTEPASSEPEEAEGSNILIAYFTYGENAKLPDDVDASAAASIQIFNIEMIRKEK